MRFQILVLWFYAEASFVFFFYLVLVKVLGFKSHIWQIPSGVRPTILGLVLLSIRVMVLGSNPECPWSHQKSQVSSPTFWICPFSSYFSALLADFFKKYVLLHKFGKCFSASSDQNQKSHDLKIKKPYSKISSYTFDKIWWIAVRIMFLSF